MRTYTVRLPVDLDIRIDALDAESATHAVEQAFAKALPVDALQGHRFPLKCHGLGWSAMVLGAVANGESPITEETLS